MQFKKEIRTRCNLKKELVTMQFKKEIGTRCNLKKELEHDAI